MTSADGKPGDEYRVELTDAAYRRRQIKCQDACPVHTDARGYVRAIADGDYRRAYLIARGPNPLASICGRICGAPCEAACRRADYDVGQAAAAAAANGLPAIYRTLLALLAQAVDQDAELT